jgi:hypothetical protein
MDRALSDFRAARERFELFEKFYLSLSGNAKEYLGRESKEYKRYLKEIQGLILPTVGKVCPTCETQCCRLYTPELSIYIAGTVGGFALEDYLLVRCDEKLPDPAYENAMKNLCPFWDVGCVLPVDCRSFLCVQYFCDNLKKELAMDPVLEILGKIRTVLNGFSVAGCMA